MKLERTKNAKKNMVMGFVNKLVSILLPFLTRTILIKEIGVDYLGLNSLFTSILSVLSLSELGFSSAIVYSMYKPIAEDDTEMICALLNFYRKVYRIVGSGILTLGVILIPFLPKLIHGSYPADINLTILYLIYLGNAVLSYYMFAYLSSVVTAYQRDDIISTINIIVSLLLNVTQVCIMLFSKNYYLYTVVLPIFTLANNLLLAFVVHKIYPQYKCYGKLSKEVKNDIKVRVSGLVINKICNTSRNAFDSIFVSMFLGLTVSAIYNNYYYIIGAVTAILSIISNSVLGGVGNSVVLEAVEKNYEDMNKMNFVYMWISGWCTICLVCLIQPFMQIWMGKELMFPVSIVCLLCLYFYILKMGDIRTIYVQVNGLWWENRYRSLIEAVGNIVLNYVLGKILGVHGIVIATIVTLFVINFGYGSRILFRYYFKEQNVKEYYRYHLLYMTVTCLIAIITYLVCQLINIGVWGNLFIRLVICCVLPNIFYFAIYRKTNIFKKSINWVINVLEN